MSVEDIVGDSVFVCPSHVVAEETTEETSEEPPEEAKEEPAEEEPGDEAEEEKEKEAKVRFLTLCAGLWPDSEGGYVNVWGTEKHLDMVCPTATMLDRRTFTQMTQRTKLQSKDVTLAFADDYAFVHMGQYINVALKGLFETLRGSPPEFIEVDLFSVFPIEFTIPGKDAVSMTWDQFVKRHSKGKSDPWFGMHPCFTRLRNMLAEPSGTRLPLYLVLPTTAPFTGGDGDPPAALPKFRLYFSYPSGTERATTRDGHQVDVVGGGTVAWHEMNVVPGALRAKRETGVPVGAKASKKTPRGK